MKFTNTSVEISKNLDCPPLIVGGVADHVHLLARLGRTITQADWVKELKRVSNLWLHQEVGLSKFHGKEVMQTFR